MKRLEQEIKKIDRRLKKGDTIKLLYGNEVIAQYNFIEKTIDSKTPLQWLRICLCFNIISKGLDINKVTLRLNN